MKTSENKINPHREIESNWKPIHVIGGICSLLMVAIILGQFIVFLSAPPPLDGTASDLFALFPQNKFMGLLASELLMVVYVILSIPLALALFVALRKTDQSFVLIYLALSLVGVVCFIVARPAFEMLAISQQYAAATTEAQKFMFLAVVETLVAAFHGTAFQVSYILGSINSLILSMIMLRSNVFSKAYARIASGVLDFGIFIPVVGLTMTPFLSQAYDHAISSQEIRNRSVPIPKRRCASSIVNSGSSGLTMKASQVGWADCQPARWKLSHPMDGSSSP